MPFKKRSSRSKRRSSLQMLPRTSGSARGFARSRVTIRPVKVWRAPVRAFDWQGASGTSFTKAVNKLLTISRSGYTKEEIRQRVTKLQLSSMYGKFGAPVKSDRWARLREFIAKAQALFNGSDPGRDPMKIVDHGSFRVPKVYMIDHPIDTDDPRTFDPATLFEEKE